METNYIYGIIGVLLLSGTGVYTILQMQEDPNIYICSVSNITGKFESLSSTNKTGYWYVDGVKKQSTCTGGYWLRPVEWANLYNISLDTTPVFETNIPDVSSDIILYKCDSKPEQPLLNCIEMVDAVCITEDDSKYTCDDWSLDTLI